MLRIRVLLVVLLASAVTACGGDADSPNLYDVAGTEKTATETKTSATQPRTGTTTAPPPARTATECAAGETRRVGSAKVAQAAVVARRATAFRTPGGAPVHTFGARNVNGVPTVLGVLEERLGTDCEPTWYRVQLPLRPNGIVGWVRAADVELATVTTRILVDLSERRVTLYDRGKAVLVAQAAIGSSATPTPTGRFYVNQRLIPRDPTGPFGPGAIGISAFSDVLTGWAQGGPIAIHGTNRPDLIGQAVSNGCIRVRNDLLRRMFDRTLAGTPVVIRA